MKKQKSRQTGRDILKQLQAAKLPAHRKRPLHVHIALHPMSILALLCMGVLLVSFTLNAVADSYLVTAVVPAPPLTQPATIQSPADGLITGTQTIVVRGMCPANSYVDLLDNGSFVGEAICNSGSYRIGATLVTGTNQLRVQDYNFTNAPGPTAGGVTVIYAPGAPQTPEDTGGSGATVVVGQLVVTQVDTNVAYQQGSKMLVSSQPTIAGVAPPLAQITILVGSKTPCTATSSLLGYWSCKIPELSSGTYAVSVSADAQGGAQLTFPTFNITVPNPPIVVAPPQLTPIAISSSYSYAVHNVGQTVSYTVSVSGGRGPYAVMVSWGDGASELTVQQTAGTFAVSHKYGWFNTAKAVKTVRVQVIDTAGQSAMLQFDTVLRNPGLHNAVAQITRTTGLGGLYEKVRPWLWVIWPGYLFVMLLVVCFWLGEREELDRIKQRRRLAALKGMKRRQAHARH